MCFKNIWVIKSSEFIVQVKLNRKQYVGNTSKINW